MPNIPEFLDASEGAYYHYNSNVGYSSIQYFSPELNWKPLQISSATTLGDGFFAIAYEDVSGNIVIAYEGTNGTANDAYGIGSRAADKTIALGGTPQSFNDAASFASTIAGEFSALPLYVTGHSLGGAEAEYAVLVTPQIRVGMTFAAPGVPFNPQDINFNVINYVDKGDAVGNWADDTYSSYEYSWVLLIDGKTSSTRYHVGTVQFIGDQHAGDLNGNVNNIIASGLLGGTVNITDHSLESTYYPDLGFSPNFGSHPPSNPPRNTVDTVGATIANPGTISVGGGFLSGTIDVLDKSYDVTVGPNSASAGTIVTLGTYAGTPVDKDWYRFSTTPGTTYTVTAVSQSLSSGRVAVSVKDLAGNTFDANHNGTTSDDVADSATGTSTIAFTATGTQYYAAVSAGGADGVWQFATGQYTVQVNQSGSQDDTPGETVPSSLTATPGVSTTIVGVSVSDPDAASRGETFTVVVSANSGIVFANSVAGASVSASGSHSLTITGTGSVSQLNSALATLSYSNGVAGSDTITVTTYDSDGSSPISKSFGVTINAGDDAVGVQVPASQVTATSGVSKAISSVQVLDDGLSGETFTVQVSDSFGALSATGSGISGSGSHTLTIAGTLSQVNAALGTLSYITSVPGGSGENIFVKVTDSDGSTITKAIGVTITAGDDAVDVQVPASQVTASTGVSKAISGVQVVDDGLNGETFTVQVSDSFGALSATGSGISGSGSHNLTIAGTLSQVNAALGTLSYITSVPGGSGENIFVKVTDSDGSTITKAIGVTITAGDDAVDLQVPASQVTATSGASKAISGVQVVDDALNGETFTVQVSDSFGALSATGSGISGSGSHNLTIAGTLSQVNAALGTLSYITSVPGGSGENVFVKVTDSDGSTITKAVGVTITASVPTTITLQPGSEGQDLWITNTFTYSDDYGVDNAQLKVGGWGDTYDTLIKFDLGTVHSSHVTSATLQLYNLADLGGTPTGMSIEEVQGSWDESYGWYSYGTRPANGGSITGDPPNLPFQHLSTVGAPGAGWISIDVTAAVNDWLSNPTSNNGLLIRPLSTNDNFNDFVSSDATGANAQFRPELVIQSDGVSHVGFAPPTSELANFGVGAGGWSSDNTYPRELADVNGDGLADIVAFGYGGVSVALATGGGHFAQPTFELAKFGVGAGAGGWSSDNTYPRELADVNGDHLADIVAFGYGGVSVALATGGGHFAQPTSELANFAVGAGGWNSNDLYPRELADVNGDGLADIVAFGYGGVSVALATGGGHFAQPTSELANFAVGAGGWSSDNTYPRELADVNGDHLADIVAFGYGGVSVALATGGGHFAQPTFELANFGVGAGGWNSDNTYPRELADVNGDGMADIVAFGYGGVSVALATGGGHFAQPTSDLANFGVGAGGWSSNDLYPRALADVNGDHRADIVAFGYGGVNVALLHDFLLI